LPTSFQLVRLVGCGHIHKQGSVPAVVSHPIDQFKLPRCRSSLEARSRRPIRFVKLQTEISSFSERVVLYFILIELAKHTAKLSRWFRTVRLLQAIHYSTRNLFWRHTIDLIQKITVWVIRTFSGLADELNDDVNEPVKCNFRSVDPVGAGW